LAQVAVPTKKKPALKKNGLLHPSSAFVFTRVQLVIYYSQQHNRPALSPKASSRCDTCTHSHFAARVAGAWALLPSVLDRAFRGEL